MKYAKRSHEKTTDTTQSELTKNMDPGLCAKSKQIVPIIGEQLKILKN